MRKRLSLTNSPSGGKAVCGSTILITNSIITAGNGGTKPTEAAFTIFYNQGTQRYDLEKTLQPDEQMWIDVGKLIREHVPDKNAKTLPSDLTMGSYEFRDLTNTGVGTLFEGKVIYDKTYGHVAYGCAGCCGYSFPYTRYDPLGVPFGGPAEQGVYAPDTCQGGAAADVSASFYNAWSVYSTATATVDYYGTHTGQSIGSTTSKTSGVLLSNGPRICPSLTRTPSGGVNVVDGFTVGYNAYIPVDHLTPGVTSCLFANTFNTPFTYIGDANRGTYRTAEQIHVMPDLQNYSGYFEDTGESRNYGYNSPANGSTLSNLDEDGIPNDCYLWNDAKKISQPFNYDVSFPYPHQAQVHYVGSAYNPLESQFATITWDMRTVLDTTSPLSPTAYVNYNHTCFPAHQIKVNGTVIYSYFPPDFSAPLIFDRLVSHINKVVNVTQPVVVPTH